MGFSVSWRSDVSSTLTPLSESEENEAHLLSLNGFLASDNHRASSSSSRVSRAGERFGYKGVPVQARGEYHCCACCAIKSRSRAMHQRSGRMTESVLSILNGRCTKTC